MTHKMTPALILAALIALPLTVVGQDGFGGSSFWMRAPDGIDTGELARRLRGESVLIEPGAVFFGSDTPDTRHYRLAYSSIPASRIADGVALIARHLDMAKH